MMDVGLEEEPASRNVINEFNCYLSVPMLLPGVVW